MTELFKLTLPSEANEALPLYFRSAGEYRLDDGAIVLSDCTLKLDCFFNLFAHTDYFNYTRTTTATLRLNLCGRGIVRLCHKNQLGQDNVLKSKAFDFSLADTLSLDFDCSYLPNEGFIFVEVQTDEACTLFGGSFWSDAEAEDIKIGVVVCTYKREEFVRRNLQKMEDYLEKNPLLGQRVGFFVIDNGNTLKDEFSIATVMGNKNLGGAGGFTRGMMEVHARANEYSHFLLMDDDISFHPETLERTAALLSLLKDEHKYSVIGAAMLRSDTPCIQHESGAWWKDYYIKPRLLNTDLSQPQNLLLRAPAPDFTGWWYSCMPTAMIDRIGLPYPLFIKQDDVEYNMRSKAQIILTHGIAVWHEPFDNKPSEWTEYYIKRNDLILTALRSKNKSLFTNYFKLLRATGKALTWQRYEKMELIFKSYRDFLKGADFLIGIDGEEYHKEILKNNPKLLPEEELCRRYGFEFCEEEFEADASQPRKFFLRLFTLNGYLLPRMFFVKKYLRQYKTVNMQNMRAVNIYRCDKLIHFHAGIRMGYATSLKKTKLFSAIGNLTSLFFLMLFKYKKAIKSYQDNQNTQALISHSSWLARLGLK